MNILKLDYALNFVQYDPPHPSPIPVHLWYKGEVYHPAWMRAAMPRRFEKRTPHSGRLEELVPEL